VWRWVSQLQCCRPSIGFSAKIEIIMLNSTFPILNSHAKAHQALLRLIDRSADEGWEELDLSGLGLEELPQSIGSHDEN
jgi:hypothetical protein